MSLAVRMLIWAAGLLVPRAIRREWKEEWDGELAALQEARTGGTVGLPSPWEYAWGAFAHGLWMRTEGWTVDSVFQDLKYSTRVLRKSPGFTLVATLTLALGIGANASIFSLVNSLLFRAPAQVHEPDRLAQIARSYESAPRWDNFSWPATQAIRDEAGAFSGIAGYSGESFVVGRGTATEQLRGQLVTGNYFEVLGVQPARGRLLQPSDDVTPGAHAVAVISHELWLGRYGGDPAVVGSTISVGAAPYEVVGVAPEGFVGVENLGTVPAMWVPVAQHSGYFGSSPFAEWGWSWINLFGRLEEGVTFREAEASIGVVQFRLREASAGNEGIEVLLSEGLGLDPEERAEANQMALILTLIVGVVLLLTCTNVANLFLARATARRAEVGVRMALGAGRGRLARQTITETLLLALLATLVATPIVLSAEKFLPMVFPFGMTGAAAPDTRVLLFTVALGIAAGLLLGVAPAWASSRRGVTEALRETNSTGGRTKTRLQDFLVVSQLGLSLGLVAGAALLGRSVMNARNAEPGFDPGGLVAAYLDLELTGRYDGEAGPVMWNRLVTSGAGIPGVRSATVASQTPLVGGHSRATVRPVGRDDVDYEAESIVVGGDYFETMGIALVRGRTLGGVTDEPERVVVVNEALARMFWPDEDPIGRELQGDPVWRVVGVVADVQLRSLRRAGRPAVYYPLSQSFLSRGVIHLRGENGNAIQPDVIREMIAGLDPELPVSRIVDLEEGVAASMGETRTIGYLVSAFAVLALVLAAVGLYGLVSYGASQRVREMGIRTALGARPESLVGLILRHGVGISVLGIGAGLAVSFGLGQVLEGLLFGVGPADFVALGAASLLLLLTAGVASWVPARRASRVDPAVSLRE